MIHLNCMGGHSFLKAYGTPEQIVSRAKELGTAYCGIADWGGTWGHIPFWKECKKQGIKPIFGVSLAVVPALEKDPRFDTVSIIATGKGGLKEQYELVTKATEQFYYRPRVTWKQLSKLKHNTIIVTSISPENESFIYSCKASLYLAALPEQGALLRNVLRGDIRVLAAVNPVYPNPRDAEAYRLVNAIGTASKTRDQTRSDRYMMGMEEYRARFAELGVKSYLVDEWLQATADLAFLCKVEPSMGTNVKPRVDETVESWCERCASDRGVDLSVEPYKSRYERELEMIYEKGFTDYFLLIADLVAWSKERMFVGPARGSSAGSLVCYLMGIVEVDPLVHGLLFERFIDINREDLPDVDIDFPDDKRDLVFDYIISKYGAERVARIGTVSVFKPKSALNDVARCYSIPKWEVEKLTEVMIERSGGDARANMAIEDTIQQFDVGRKLIEQYPNLAMASKIEGHARHTGKHAAGVIVADKPVANYFSVNRREGAYIGQINKYDAEAIGLLKIDALGLKTLAVIDDCCAQVGIDPRSLYRLDLEQEGAFRIFQEDKVAGIFQFEGYAVRSLMRQMGVEYFGDIVALTALARPGPLHCGAANEFIERRTDKVDWDYVVPELKEFTKDTYGTIVYQEQVMQIARGLGDMSWQEVSELRRAMSKSLGEEFFNQYRDKFLIGTRKKGIKDETAIELWEYMCTFGSWAFNLSHAVSYALLSYWCAYLKSEFPLEFAVAHLRRTDSQDHVLRLLRELIKEGIPMIPFDIEKSQESWTVQDGKIYGGFRSVKGIGPKTAEKFLALKEETGDWVAQLSPVQRSKLLAPNNTPWHNINRLQKEYADLYNDPDNWFTPLTPKGVTGPVVKVEDIIEEKGEYCFIATMKQRNLRDLNETQSLVKRGGKRVKHHELFLNLTMEDDTSSILCTIDRWKYPDIGIPIMEAQADGQDFLVRGRVRQDGWRKIHIERIVRLQNGSTRLPEGAGGEAQEDSPGAASPEGVDGPDNGSGPDKGGEAAG